MSSMIQDFCFRKCLKLWVKLISCEILSAKLHDLTTIRMIYCQYIFFLSRLPPNGISKYILIDVIFPLVEIALYFVIRMNFYRLCTFLLIIFSCVHLLFYFIMWQISRCLLLTVDWMVVCIFTHFHSNFV